MTNVAEEFGICHSITSLERIFNDRNSCSSVQQKSPLATTTAVDRYIVLKAIRNRQKRSRVIGTHMEQTTARQK